MFLNRTSSALFPWLLWLLFLPTPATATTGSTPTSAASPPANTTLLFDSGAPGHSLRNCSCSTPIQECDEALANLLCSCRTVPRSALPPAGLREPGSLIVWLKETWILEELLNRSMIGHLHLSFCGINPLDSQYLALIGLQTLRIHSAVPGVPYPNQKITVAPAAGAEVELESLSSSASTSSSSSFSSSSSSSPPSSSIFHMTVLDVAALNGLSALKAYSVVGPPISTLSQHFPHLPVAVPLPSSAPHNDPTEPGEQAAEPQYNCVLTFVY
ncbi:uncharacterized protein C21orf62-like [Myripristis murdjan]|uniref:uncharacterized protein C21orf62-like n=1 Tax=Myripristis murdjan TaxID=586833 RepID=UPI001175DA0D|nr:uncharacterized protein C21orf62 homolog [Myripristis murdjan]